MIDRDMVDRLARELIDRGRLIEAGWISLQRFAIPSDASEIQLREMRMAFFAGAQHVFGSIMGILEPGEEPTEADMERMDKISDELAEFVEELRRRALHEKGKVKDDAG